MIIDYFLIEIILFFITFLQSIFFIKITQTIKKVIKKVDFLMFKPNAKIK